MAERTEFDKGWMEGYAAGRKEGLADGLVARAEDAAYAQGYAEGRDSVLGALRVFQEEQSDGTEPDDEWPEGDGSCDVGCPTCCTDDPDADLRDAQTAQVRAQTALTEAQTRAFDKANT